MKEFLSKNLIFVGMVLSLVLFSFLMVDNNKKEENLRKTKQENIVTIKDTKESSYEAGCNNGSHQSCLLLQDIKDRYAQCLQSALINCKTWAIQYRDESTASRKLKDLKENALIKKDEK